ncbi:MAG: N-acetylmuramoyl-L-alanine amidase [Bacteroidetes bacterium]|nr:N-acetylmuramoyl-L-alanine amidase [Bacteroidota bacterium]
MKQALLFLLALPILAFSENKISSPENYSAYFEKAYQQYPSIPRGVLEAVAYTNTHIQNITHNPGDAESCAGLPYYYGVMGLVKDGKNVFRNNLVTVSQMSGIAVNDMLNDAEKNILAYAAAYAQAQNNFSPNGNLPNGKSTVESQLPVIIYLSELPNSGSLQDNFTMNTNLYSVLNFLNDKNNSKQYNFPQYSINLEKVFGKENYKVLSSSHIKASDYKITNENGNEYEYDNSIPQNNLKNDLPVTQSTDYAPAIWNAAASCNYTVGRSVAISAVVIHDTEGSYAGAIAWFQDCSSSVSAHYVLRSSDGQVTQMVLEKNKAWHVGTENGYTIGIEHEGYQAKTGWYTTAMYNSSANLVKDICNSGYGINPATCWNGPSCNGICLLSTSYRIKGHQHYPNSNHDDPGPNWNWYTYYNLLNGSSPPPSTAPANDNCSAAQTLTPGTTCVSTSGDVSGATQSGLSKASCDVYSGTPALKDVWYKFTATATTHTITLTPSSGMDGVLSLYTSCSGNQIGCSDNGGGPGGTEKISASALTVGSTYFIRVYSYGSSTPSTTTFNICITAPPASTAPSNDNCSNAIALTPNTSCVSTSGTLANATVSGLSKASCDASSYSSLKDVWYKFTATATTHTITCTPSSGLDAVLSLYTSCSGSQIGCSDNGGGPGGTEKISASGLTVGSAYYIRIYPYGSSSPTTNTFNVCVTAPSSTPPPAVNCTKTYKTTIEGFDVYQHNSGAIMFRAKMAIDADGSPRAYGPNDSGLDYTANAGYPGNWWGVVTDSYGNPIIQTSSDPYPGLYVSTTSLVNSAYSSTKTQHYVNSEVVPFFVLPSAITSMGVKLGDVAYVYNTSNGKSCYAIFADGGPSGKLGEGSIYLANQLGINSNARTGGTSSGIIDYVIFPNSGYGQGTIPSVSQINSIGSTKLNAIGGSGITSCIPAAPPIISQRDASTAEEEKNSPVEVAAENSLVVYPNPFDGITLHGKFSVAGDNAMSVKIYDMTGREIFSRQLIVSVGEFTLPFDEKLQNGMYILQGIVNDKSFTQRLIVR